ncbi:hypothetical protein AAY473_035460 [Plecturocebus cupreus]
MGGASVVFWGSEEFETSLGNVVKTPISTKNTKISWAWWYTPIIPTTQEAEAGESLEPRRQRGLHGNYEERQFSVAGDSVWQGLASSEGLSSSHALAGPGGPGVLLLGGHVEHEVHHPVTVAKFIVIPGNELDKVVIEGNASPSIEGGRMGVAVEVRGHHLVFSVAQDALEGALRHLLHYLLDVIIFGRFFQMADEFHH